MRSRTTSLLIGYAVLAGGPGLMLVVEKFPGANVRAVTEGVEEALEALRPGLSSVEIDPDVYQAQTFIDTALHTLGVWAVAGPALLLALLALVLFSWRLVLISFVTIALSLVAAMYVLYLAGAGFNLMVLSGLAVAVGLIVNDALLDLGSLRRRMHEQRSSGDVASTVGAVAEVVGVFRAPQLYATPIVLLAVLPFFFLGGVTEAFSRPAVMAYCLAVLSSTVVALTVTPALAFMLLRNEPLQQRTCRSPNARRHFELTFQRYGRRSRWAYATLAILLLAVCAAAPQLGRGSLFPVSRPARLTPSQCPSTVQTSRCCVPRRKRCDGRSRRCPAWSNRRFVQVLRPIFVLPPERLTFPVGLLGTLAALVIGGSVLSALSASALVRRLNPIELLREE
jgi:Cu/Ag efflux pump CusA